MERRTGIWVDHHEALVITLTSFGATIERARSEAGKRSRSKQEPSPEGDARYHQKLKLYYDRIANLVKKSDEIYICGPGKAKLELRKVLKERAENTPRLLAVQPLDRLSDKQFLAHVRKHYEEPRAKSAGA